MDIRELAREEFPAALELVRRVFLEFEAPECPEESRAAFEEAVQDPAYQSALTSFGAFEGERLIGVLATRKEGSHIALFFVDGAYHRRGIGRQLWQAALEASSADIITAHSSMYARAVYARLGFIATNSLQVEDGIRYIPMAYPRFIDRLVECDDKTACALMKRIAAESAENDSCHPFIPALVPLLTNPKSYVRTRAFILICAQARWDENGGIAGVLPSMVPLFNDPKPTVVRQCLSAIKEVLLYRPELGAPIRSALESIDLSGYRDSMTPLIRRDIDEVLKLID